MGKEDLTKEWLQDNCNKILINKERGMQTELTKDTEIKEIEGFELNNYRCFDKYEVVEK